MLASTQTRHGILLCGAYSLYEEETNMVKE